jgi:hypothetical protein
MAKAQVTLGAPNLVSPTQMEAEATVIVVTGTTTRIFWLGTVSLDPSITPSAILTAIKTAVSNRVSTASGGVIVLAGSDIFVFGAPQ